MVREEVCRSQCLYPLPTAPLHWLTSSRNCATALWPSTGTKCHTSILTRDCEQTLPQEPLHPSGPLPPPAPCPLSRAHRHGQARSAPQPRIISADSFPQSGRTLACSEPSFAGYVPTSPPLSDPGQWLRFLCLPLALCRRDLPALSEGQPREASGSFWAQSTVLSLQQVPCYHLCPIPGTKPHCCLKPP